VYFVYYFLWSQSRALTRFLCFHYTTISGFKTWQMNSRTHRANPNTICPPAQPRQSPFPCVTAKASPRIFCQLSGETLGRTVCEAMAASGWKESFVPTRPVCGKHWRMNQMHSAHARRQSHFRRVRQSHGTGRLCPHCQVYAASAG